jgi:hypothetical protein
MFPIRSLTPQQAKVFAIAAGFILETMPLTEVILPLLKRCLQPFQSFLDMGQ